MHYSWFWIALGNLFYFSLIEYWLHRRVMHKPVGKFTYPYEAHHKTHHRIFRFDDTYHLINKKDKWTIPMAWWNGIILVLIGIIPPSLLGWVCRSWAIPIIAALLGGVYYLIYERIHWCMHLPLPTKRIVESLPLIGWTYRRLNGHHLLHHRWMNRNFNVVFPFWDLVLGTLLIRAPVGFKQARGHSVPDVQPKLKVSDTARSAWLKTP